jgi:DNA repair protein RadC
VERLAIQRGGLRVLTRAEWENIVHVPNPATAGNDLARAVASMIPEDGREHLVAVALDVHQKPLAWSIVSSGTVDAVMMQPRDVFAWALLVPGVRFVGVAHNHPSGDVTPSGADKSSSVNLAKCGQSLDVQVLWSLVVTHLSDAWKSIPLEQKQPPKGGDDAGGVRPPEAEPEAGPDGDSPEPDGDPDDDKPEPDGDDDKGDPDDESQPDGDKGVPNGESGGVQTGADLDALKAAVARVIRR